MPSRFLFAVILALLAAGPAAATVASRQLTIAELVRHSDVVVRGTVRNVESVVADGRPVTRAELDPLEFLKGRSDTRALVVVAYGGSDGRYLTRVQGSARLSAGEEAVFFLRSAGLGRYAVTALAEGKFRVVRGRAVAALVERDLSGIEFRNGTPAGGAVATLAALRLSIQRATREETEP